MSCWFQTPLWYKTFLFWTQTLLLENVIKLSRYVWFANQMNLSTFVTILNIPSKVLAAAGVDKWIHG